MPRATVVEELRHYASDARLRDGRRIHVRAIRPDDRDRLLEHFKSLSCESVYKRFLSAKSRLSEAEVRSLTELDFDRHVGLVATVDREEGETILGVARYILLGESNPPRAELAVAVRDDDQGLGVGSALLARLLQIAVTRGLRCFEADLLDDNEPILRMIRHSGLALESSRQQGVRHVSLTVPTSRRGLRGAREVRSGC
jgi:GNAT superfamily N-acetyltransferase